MREVRRKTLGAILLACCGALLVGCTEAGPTAKDAPENENPKLLQTKLSALMADECYADDPARTYPRCGKFFTQLASTVGSVDQELAGNNAADKRAAAQLRSAVDSYQGLGCDATDGQPTGEQRTGCPQTLRTVHSSLDTLTR